MTSFNLRPSLGVGNRRLPGFGSLRQQRLVVFFRERGCGLRRRVSALALRQQLRTMDRAATA